MFKPIKFPNLLLQGYELSYRYENQLIFNNINLSITNNICIVLKGPNSSGKTTLLKILSGQLKPYTGNIYYNNINYNDLFPQYYSTFIYLTTAQTSIIANSLFEQFTNTIKLFNDYTLSLSLVWKVLSVFNLNKKSLKSLKELSFGTLQRLKLSTLIASIRPIWILDEPLLGLDAEGQEVFIKLLEQHLTIGGCAIIATHTDFFIPNSTLQVTL